MSKNLIFLLFIDFIGRISWRMNKLITFSDSLAKKHLIWHHDYGFKMSCFHWSMNQIFITTILKNDHQIRVNYLFQYCNFEHLNRYLVARFQGESTL